MPAKISDNKCLGESCSKCIPICPVDAIVMYKKTDKAKVIESVCTDCEECIEVCPEAAISM
jgi:Na+-translocating ferredoxin:NAD+ oxidoreductase RNF subunit RnfB